MSTTNQTKTVVGIGELLWDLLPAGPQLGGAPANFAYHAKVLCGQGIPVSCIGNDDLGKNALALLEQHGLSKAYVAVDENRTTGTVTVTLDDAGVPSYTIHEGVAWDFVPETPALQQLAQQADAICFGSLAQRSPMTRSTIHAFLDAARPDCLKVFDINLRQAYYDEDTIRASLNQANVLKLNDEELPVLMDMLGLSGNESGVLKALIEAYSLKVIALTKGAEGALLATCDEEIDNTGMKPDAIADTVGAGDAFTAAMTAGLLYGHSLSRICKDANCLASYVCSQHGAMPLIPDHLQVRNTI